LPKPVIQRLNELQRMVADPAVQETLRTAGVDIEAGSPEAMRLIVADPVRSGIDLMDRIGDIDTSCRRRRNSLAQTSLPDPYMKSGLCGRCPTGWLRIAATTRCGARSTSASSRTAADAVAEEGELADAEMVHQAELIVGEGVPGIGDRDRPDGLAVRGVSLIHGDHAEVVLEFLHDVDHRVWPVDHARVQAAAGRRQQREARAGLGLADADIALLVESDLEARRQTMRDRCLRCLSEYP
jgi:hypothetical protein